MKFINFFFIVLLVFIIIYILILLAIRNLNKLFISQKNLESNESIPQNEYNFTKKMKILLNNFLQLFDNELIRYEEANEKIKSNYFDYIIDVRTKSEWEKQHYPTSINIPIDPEDKFKKEIDYYNRRLKFLLYCKSGRRAKIASDIMKKMDFQNVRYLIGTYNKLDIYKKKNELMNPN